MTSSRASRYFRLVWRSRIPSRARRELGPPLARSPRAAPRGLTSRKRRRLARALRTAPAPAGPSTPARLQCVADLAELGLIRGLDARRLEAVGHVGDEAWQIVRLIAEAYPPHTLGITVVPYWRRSWRSRALVLAACAAIVAAMTLVALDITDQTVAIWIDRHTWTSAVATSGTLVLVTYALVQRSADRSVAARWMALAAQPLAAHATEVSRLRNAVELYLAQFCFLKAEPATTGARSVDEAAMRARFDRVGKSMEITRQRLEALFGSVKDYRAGLSVVLTGATDLAYLSRTLHDLDDALAALPSSLRRPSDEPELGGDAQLDLEEGRMILYEALNHHVMAIHALFGATPVDQLFVEPVPLDLLPGVLDRIDELDALDSIVDETPSDLSVTPALLAALVLRKNPRAVPPW